MLRMIYVLRRLPNLSRQEFQSYWRKNHGPLVREHVSALRVRRYVQVHTIDDPMNDELQASRGTMEPYDGVAEGSWNDREDLVMGFNLPEGQRAGEKLLEDERRFIDFSRSALWVGEEHVFIDGDGKTVAKEESSIVKIFFALRRLPNLSKEEFHRYWLEKHGPFARQRAGALRGILRYVQVHTIDDPMNDELRASRDAMEPYDGVAEAWADLEELAKVSSTLDGQRAWSELVEDEGRFIDFSRSSIWVAKEHVFYEV